MTVSVEAFRIWVSGASPGDEFVYHQGSLSDDSDARRHGKKADELNAVIDVALSEAGRGRVKLLQRPVAGAIGAYVYFVRAL